MYKDKKQFFRVTGLRRLKYLSWWAVAIIVVGLVVAAALMMRSVSQAGPELPGFFTWLYHLFAAVSLGASDAHAGESASSAATDDGADRLPFDPRVIANLAIIAGVFIAFFWSLAIFLHSNNEKRVTRASDILKMLLGFLVGSGQRYLGLG